MNKVVMRIEKYLGAGLLKLLDASVRITRFGDEPQEPIIFMVWHRDQIPSCFLHKNKQVGVLISKSKDGELIAGPLSLLGYFPVRGSSSRGGTQALRNLLSHLKEKSVAITPDGPRGPIYSIKDGLLTTAYLSKRPIVPVAIDINREWIFNSWDRFRFPKPFSKIRVKYGVKHYVENKADFEEIRNALKSEMTELYSSIKFKK